MCPWANISYWYVHIHIYAYICIYIYMCVHQHRCLSLELHPKQNTPDHLTRWPNSSKSAPPGAQRPRGRAVAQRRPGAGEGWYRQYEWILFYIVYVYYVHICIHARVWVCVCVLICIIFTVDRMYGCGWIYIYMYIYIYILIYIYMHTYPWHIDSAFRLNRYPNVRSRWTYTDQIPRM